MPRYLHTDADFDAALAKLVQADPRLAPVLAKAGRPDLRRREAGFEGLCAIVIGQQLSTSSAAARWRSGLPIDLPRSQRVPPTKAASATSTSAPTVASL